MFKQEARRLLTERRTNPESKQLKRRLAEVEREIDNIMVLNERGETTVKDGRWTATSVRRLRQRLGLDGDRTTKLPSDACSEAAPCSHARVRGTYGACGEGGDALGAQRNIN